MKAIYHSQYRKPGTGNIMYTYTITGTAKEIEEYLITQEASTGKAAGTWPKADNGAPLWWLNASLEKRSGNVPEMSYNLIFNRDKTKIIRDDSAKQLAGYKRIAEKKEDEMAKLMAQIELGIIEVPTRGGNMRVNTTNTGAQLQAPEGAAAGEAKSLTDTIMQGVGETVGEPGSEDLGE